MARRKAATPFPATSGRDGLRDGLLTLEEAATYLKIARGTLKNWVSEKRIEHVKVGKLIRFRKEALDRYIAQQTVAAIEI